MEFETKTIHGGLKPDPLTGAVMTPIYQTSTYAQTSPHNHKGYEYSRTHNPTRTALESNLATLENGKHGLTFSSGMAAIDALVKLFNPGDEIICTSDLYGGTHRLFTQIFAKYGIKFRFVDLTDLSNLESVITEKTKLIWAETPTNPTLKIVDLAGLSAIAKSHNLLLAVDNTFASPYLQNPIDCGADIVMHSITKYIGGHSDVVMGALILKDDSLIEQLRFIQNSCGAVPGPMDCFLTLRGIKTLHVRMQRHSENGRAVAEYLAKHPKVNEVLWPGFKDHLNHDVAKQQMRDFGGMLSFSTKGNNLDNTLKLLSSFKVFALAESLGGVESLCGHPAIMTHASIPKEDREANGISDSLVRLSVGIENEKDLIQDLEQALALI